MKEREKMKRNKLITLGALLTSSLAITMPLITSCSTTLEVPPTEAKCANNSICWFYDYTGISPRYSFHNVVGNSTQLPESYLLVQDEITGERIRVEVTLRTLDNYLQWEQGGSPLFSCTKVVK